MLMRFASVSKLITAVGIMKLQEMKKLKLNEKVFGEKGILNDTTYNNGIKDPSRIRGRRAGSRCG